MSGFGNIPPFYTGYNPAQVADYLRGATQTWTGVNTFLNAASQLKFGTAVDQGAITGTATNATFAYGAEYNGSAYRARQTSATIFSASNVAFTWNLNSGLTPGNTFTPTELMRLNANGLGVKTSSPDCALDVGGTIRTTGSQIPTSGAGGEFRWNGTATKVQSHDRTAGTYQPLELVGSTVKIAPSDVTIATATATGLGIGTSNPGNKLDVQSSAAQAFFGTAADTGGWLFGNNTGLRASFGSKWDGSQWPATATSSSLMQAGAGVLTFYCNTGLTPGNTFTPTERMRLDATGLGIGTTNPNCKVDAGGTIRATGRTDPPSGTGVEMCYNTGGDTGSIVSYNRTGAAYKPLGISASVINLMPGGNVALAIGTTGITASLPVQFASYTLSTLPTAASFPRSQVWCSDHTGGARFVYSDGTAWRDIRTGNVAA